MAKNPLDFSVIVTVYNEAKSIIPLLDSLKNQTMKPAEIVISDAGSTDQTARLIKKWQTGNPTTKLILIKSPGANRSRGRNVAIEKAGNQYIAVTDAGCEADPGWLSNLAKAFKNGSTEAAAGFYRPITKNRLQYCFSLYTGVSQSQYNPETFIPSSRSLAFTKKAWEMAGKYPEQLDTCEDLPFAAALKKTGKMEPAPKAIVYWRQAGSMPAYFNQIAGYAKGDVEAGYRPHLKKITTVYLRYLIFLIYPPLIILYLIFFPTIKFWRQCLKNGSIFLLPLVQLTTDLAVIWGSASALLDSVSRKTRQVK